MTEPVFRLAALQDASQVQTISAEAYIPAYQATIGAVPKPAFEDYSNRIHAGNVWLAEIDKEAVGVLVLDPMPNYLLVYSIAVIPDKQGHGLGKSLLAFSELRARAINLSEIRLYTNVRMKKNVALYRASGFIDIGTRPHPSRFGEAIVDMAKMLPR